jgi:hypothetical protein
MRSNKGQTRQKTAGEAQKAEDAAMKAQKKFDRVVSRKGRLADLAERSVK